MYIVLASSRIYSAGRQAITRDDYDDEVIPVPDSLGKKAILIDIFTSRGYFKGQGVLIFPRLVLGIRSSVGILALPFRPLPRIVSFPFSLYVCFS